MFNTAIELHAIPQSQYQKAVDARLAEVKIAREKKLEDESKLAETQETTESSETEETEEETDETYVNDLGITVIKYPDVEEDQMDIFLIQGKANYDRFYYFLRSFFTKKIQKIIHKNPINIIK